VDETFVWISPLGLSVLLFTGIGTLWILIGMLTVPFLKKANPDYLFVSVPTDTAFFGAPPPQLAPPGSPLAKLRWMLIIILAGFLVLAGTLFVLVALFALRKGETWALVALGVSGLAAVFYWGFALLPYFRAGVRVSLGDLPPFIWIPTALLLPALILGWIGLP
jgi:hypothetical protein